MQLSEGDRARLEALYAHYNSRTWVHPDPLEYVYLYPDPQDREVVALIASSLAYGHVLQILKSVSWVLKRMGPAPSTFVRDANDAALTRAFAGFRYRYSTDQELIALMRGIRHVLRRYGSIRDCFLRAYEDTHETVLPALSHLVRRLMEPSRRPKNSLLPVPERGSACKRLNLFLRWIIRVDQVDPGGWEDVGSEKLLVPLDRHMHRICKALGMTQRCSGDMRTVLEVTEAFRGIVPHDPVRYDFALTRLGIREDGDPEAFIAACRGPFDDNRGG
jgi:uncharacterized protein (TIGR02757 family)